jgi:hypothetical protein
MWGRYLPMREIARQAASPEVNLGVDDLHRILSLHVWPFITMTEFPRQQGGI